MKQFVRRCFPVMLATAMAGGLWAAAKAQTKAKAAETAPAKAMGTRTAPIVMEVFSDFQCPACRALYQETLRQVIENYVYSGKVYLVHRDMPLVHVHKYARDAARWANAAARVGKFEKVVEALYAKQDSWSQDGNIELVMAGVLTPAELKRARELVKDKTIDEAIEKDAALGRALQVNQTPTIFVTHKGQMMPLAGGVKYFILKEYLDYLLKQ